MARAVEVAKRAQIETIAPRGTNRTAARVPFSLVTYLYIPKRIVRADKLASLLSRLFVRLGAAPAYK